MEKNLHRSTDPTPRGVGASVQKEIRAIRAIRGKKLREAERLWQIAVQRVWTLIAKEKESGLLPEEKVELDDYLKLEHLVVLAKTRALAAQHG